MKTFRIIVEFENAPDDFPMDVAKEMACQGISRIEGVEAEDGADYTYKVIDIHKANLQ